MHAPRLLLLDEPFTGLDQASARPRWSRGCKRSSATAVSSCWPPTISTWPRACCRAPCICATAASWHMTRGRDRCASATAPPSTHHERLLPRRRARVRKDLAVEVRSWELVLDDGVLRRVGVLVFAFGLRREGRAVVMSRPASSGSRSRFRARWRSGARSSESDKPRRCAPCCWRPPIVRRSTWASSSVSCCCWRSRRSSWCPLVGLFFQAPMTSSPLLLRGAARYWHNRLRGRRYAVCRHARSGTQSRRACSRSCCIPSRFQ